MGVSGVRSWLVCGTTGQDGGSKSPDEGRGVAVIKGVQ